MTTDYCNILKEFFEEIKAGTIIEKGVGLCWNLECFCIAHDLSYPEIVCTRKIFKNMLCNFPKYTGHPIYPLVPMDEYDTHSREQVDFYDPTTSYGAIRLEFVDWALKELAQSEASYMKS